MPEHRTAAWPRRLIGELRRSEGQAILEFVLVLPLIVTLVFVIVQLGITFSNYIQVTDAARVGARAAAVARLNGQNTCDAAQSAVSNVNSSFGFHCTFPNGTSPGDQVSITVTDPWDIELPLIGISTGRRQLTGTSTEALE
jgi:Flp pilus assembly protein TadG